MGSKSRRRKPGPRFKTPAAYGPADRAKLYEEYIDLCKLLGTTAWGRGDLPNHELIDAVVILRLRAQRLTTKAHGKVIVDDNNVEYHSRRQSLRATKAQSTKAAIEQAAAVKRRGLLDG